VAFFTSTLRPVAGVAVALACGAGRGRAGAVAVAPGAGMGFASHPLIMSEAGTAMTAKRALRRMHFLSR
jgi:hypothetical protein